MNEPPPDTSWIRFDDIGTTIRKPRWLNRGRGTSPARKWKNRVAPLRGEEELSLEEQECGTWYGCRWKPHQPNLYIVEGGVYANPNRCVQCNQVIRHDGDTWVAEQFVIHEEDEI